MYRKGLLLIIKKKNSNLQLKFIYWPHEINQIWICPLQVNYKTAFQNSSYRQYTVHLIAGCINSFNLFWPPSWTVATQDSTMECTKG